MAIGLQAPLSALLRLTAVRPGPRALWPGPWGGSETSSQGCDHGFGGHHRSAPPGCISRGSGHTARGVLVCDIDEVVDDAEMCCVVCVGAGGSKSDSVPSLPTSRGIGSCGQEVCTHDDCRPRRRHIAVHGVREHLAAVEGTCQHPLASPIDVSAPHLLLPTQPTHVTASPAIHTAPTNPHATTQPHLHASCQCPHATPPSPHHLHPPHSTATAPASHPQAQTMPSFVRVAVAVARIVGVPELGAGAAWHVATPGSSGVGVGGFRRPPTAVACAPFRAVSLPPNF